MSFTTQINDVVMSLKPEQLVMITENTYWTWECPECGYDNKCLDYPGVLKCYFCEETFKGE